MVKMLEKGWVDPSVVSEGAAATRVQEHSGIWPISQEQVDWIVQVFAPAPPAARDRLHVPSKAGCFRRCGHRALDRASLHQGRTTQAWERNRPYCTSERQLKPLEGLLVFPGNSFPNFWFDICAKRQESPPARLLAPSL